MSNEQQVIESQNKKGKIYELVSGNVDFEQSLKLRQQIDELFNASPNASSLKEYSDDILSQNIINVYKGLNRIRLILYSFKPTPTNTSESLIQNILDLPCLDKICEIALSSQVNLLMYEAHRIISKIGTGNENQCHEIIKRKGIEIMFKGISSEYDLIVDEAVLSMGNFSTEFAIRDMLVQNNAIQKLLYIAEKESFQNKDLQQTIIWALSNIVRTQPCITESKNNKLTVFFCNVIKERDDEEILIDALWSLARLCEKEEQINLIFQRNVLPKLVTLMQQQNKSMLLPTMRIIGNLLTGDEDQTDLILSYRILDIYRILLESTEKVIIREACWTISNIAAGSTSQVKQILRNQSLMLKLLSIINQQNMAFNKEIKWIFSNAIRYGELDDIEYAIDLGLLQGIKKLLTQSLDEEELTITLTDIEELLKKTKYIDTKIQNKVIEDQALKKIIESLQHHSHQKVQSQALLILQKYYCGRKKNR